MNAKKTSDDLEQARATELAAELAEGRERERSLKKSLERYKELVEMLPETVFEMDLNGNLSFVNQKSSILP